MLVLARRTPVWPDARRFGPTHAGLARRTLFRGDVGPLTALPRALTPAGRGQGLGSLAGSRQD